MYYTCITRMYYTINPWRFEAEKNNTCNNSMFYWGFITSIRLYTSRIDVKMHLLWFELHICQISRMVMTRINESFFWGIIIFSCSLNFFKLNQIWFVITLFWLIWHQTEFHFVPNQSDSVITFHIWFNFNTI